MDYTPQSQFSDNGEIFGHKRENKLWLEFFAEIKYPAVDLTAWPDSPRAEPRSAERDIKLLAPVMNVPVKLLYLSLITTFPLFILVRGP